MVYRMASMAAVSFILARDTVNEQINEELTLVASGQVEALSNVMGMLRAVVANIADTKRVAELLSAVNAQKTSPSTHATETLRQLLPAGQQTLKSVAEHFSRVSGAGLVDKAGTIVAHTVAAEAATRQAEIATQQAEEARAAAENARRDGMLAAAQQLEQVVKHIFSTSHTLMQLITESEQGTGRQSARLSETAVAMEEMTSTVLEVSRSASQTSDLTLDTREKAQQGAQLVEASIARIQQIQQDSLNLKQDMADLGQSAHDITQIMAVISDIADQVRAIATASEQQSATSEEINQSISQIDSIAHETATAMRKAGVAMNDMVQQATALQQLVIQLKKG